MHPHGGCVNTNTNDSHLRIQAMRMIFVKSFALAIAGTARPLHGDVDRFTGSGGQGVGSQRAGSVGFPLLIPPDRAHWPRYITAPDVLRHRAAGAVRVALGTVMLTGTRVRPRG